MKFYKVCGKVDLTMPYDDAINFYAVKNINYFYKYSG